MPLRHGRAGGGAFMALLALILLAAPSACREAEMTHDRIDVQAPGPDGLPGIFWIIKQEDMAALAAWLDAGGDIEASGYHGATPVLAAAVTDNWPAVLYLLERGAHADVSDGRGFTLGHLATVSRVDMSGPYGKALAQLRSLLADRGLLTRVYAPAEVRALRADGRWPPR